MALIQCSECGRQVSDKANACPHCGAPISRLRQEYVYYDNDSSNKGNNTALWIVVALLALLILGASGWYWHNSEMKRAELERQLDAVAVGTTAAVVAPAVDTIAIPAEEYRTEEVKTKSTVYMDFWGSIGETSCTDFVMNGTTGYYILEGQEGVRRTLKLKSFNESSGYCVIDAYLRDKYIGKFEGTFSQFDCGADYKCKFISVNGTVLDSYLYVD